MPTIHIYHPYAGNEVAGILQATCMAVSAGAALPPDKVWAFWHAIPLAQACRPDWNEGGAVGPMVRMFCKRGHSPERVQLIMQLLREHLARALDCAPGRVFVQVIRVNDDEVLNVE